MTVHDFSEVSGQGSNVYDVAIIGAGIGGLVTAFELSQRGLSVIVLEKQGQAGGKIRTSFIQGIEVDMGAEAFASSFAVTRLAEDLGVEMIAPSHGTSWVYDDVHDVSYELPASGIFSIPYLSPSGRLQKNPGHNLSEDPNDPSKDRTSAGSDAVGDLEIHEDLENLVSSQALAEIASDLSEPLSADTKACLSSGEMTVRQLLENRLGKEAVTRIVVPVISAINGSERLDESINSIHPELAFQTLNFESVTEAARYLKLGYDQKSEGVGQRSQPSLYSFVSTMHELIKALESYVTRQDNVMVVYGAQVEKIESIRCDPIDGGSQKSELSQCSSAFSLDFVMNNNSVSKSSFQKYTATVSNVIDASNSLLESTQLGGHKNEESNDSVVVAIALKTHNNPAIKERRRGNGVLIAGGQTDDAGVEFPVAKAVTHVSSKWAQRPDVRALSADGVDIFRLSFARNRWAAIQCQGSVHQSLAENLSKVFHEPVASDDILEYTVDYHRGVGQKNPEAVSRMCKILSGSNTPSETGDILFVGSQYSGGSVATIIKDVQDIVKDLYGPRTRLAN